MKILATGLSGLVGSRIEELLNDKYTFESSEVNIEDKEKILEKVTSSNSEIVLHLAAKTDVDGCEKDKELGENGEAWRVNVAGTKNIVDACLETNKKLIYISTDFVFDGESKTPYSEENKGNPINWYGKTKYEAENIVKNSNLDFLILRIAYPFRKNFTKNDFARKLVDLISQGTKVSMVTDHIMTPTFIDDIAYALESLIENKTRGVFHVVGSQFVSPYDCAIKIADTFGFDKSLISQTTREEFFKNRATRPFYLGLKNDKIGELKIKMRTFEEGLKELIK